MASETTAAPLEPGWALLFQGAEARVYTAPDALGGTCVVKERLAKPYRHPDLDAKINKARLKSEVRNMLRAAKTGVSVARVDFVDKERRRIVMERVPGRTLKAVVDDAGVEPARKRDAVARLGEAGARLHLGGLVHGDLTTSNAMVRPDGSLTMLDFGLALGSKSVEDHAVDLYVLERAFLSTHPGSEPLFAHALAAYERGMGARAAAVRAQFEDVRLRGRKRVAFG